MAFDVTALTAYIEDMDSTEGECHYSMITLICNLSFIVKRSDLEEKTGY